jgi:hypothetical protein
MASPSEPKDLNSHQRSTLHKLFQHSGGHNIEWRAVVSLLEAVGFVEHRGGKVAVTVGSQTGFFDVPSHKEIDMQTVVDLRHLLAAAGYESEAGIGE